MTVCPNCQIVLSDIDDVMVLGALHLSKAMGEAQQPNTVYVIVVNNEFAKIGFTQASDASGRLGDMQKYCPYEFDIKFEGAGGKPLEQALHAIFSEYRYRDEWFHYRGAVKEFCERVYAVLPKRSISFVSIQDRISKVSIKEDR